MMRAMVYQEYGPAHVLQLEELDKPLPGEDELLLKVHSASVNWLDWHFLTGKPIMARLIAGGLLKPKNQILGVDVAGTIEAVGSKITRFHPGMEVFGTSGYGCFAEYVCLREDEVQLKPSNLTFEQSAVVGAAASIALQGLRDVGAIMPGQKVLINGAAGGVGTFAVQIARAYQAEVTGVCSTANLELLESVGTDHVIDYTREDFTQNGICYDLIFDVVAKRAFSDCKRALKTGGIYVTTAFTPGIALEALWTSVFGIKKIAPVIPKKPSQTDLAFISELLGEGKVKPIIDRCYPLIELPEALLYLSQGHTRGKIAITVLNE